MRCSVLTSHDRKGAGFSMDRGRPGRLSLAGKMPAVQTRRHHSLAAVAR